MTGGETSVTHIHRSVALAALHNAAIILFSAEGFHGPLVHPEHTTKEESVFTGGAKLLECTTTGVLLKCLIIKMLPNVYSTSLLPV